MRIVARRIENVIVLGFDSGEMLDCDVASDVRSQAMRLLDSRSDVVVDLSNLEFVDSAGLGVLVSLYRRVTGRGRRIVLAKPQPYVMRVMRVIRLDRVFELFPDVDAAAHALREVESVGVCETGTPR